MTTKLTTEQDHALTQLTEFMKSYTSQRNLGIKLPTLTWVQEFKEVPIPISNASPSALEETWVECGAWVSHYFSFDGDVVDPEDFVQDALEELEDNGHTFFQEALSDMGITHEDLTYELAQTLMQDAISSDVYGGILSSGASVHVPVLTNPHFTTKACERFILSNKHNLHKDRDGECHTVMDYAYRNREMEELFKALATLTGVPLESTYNEPRKVNKEFMDCNLAGPFTEGD